jgi:ribose 5-phosphate isomerase B
MKIAFGNDHAGYAHKTKIIAFLKGKKHEVLEFGCNSADSCDYSPVAKEVALKVARGAAEKGILICGTGVGMSIAANKIKGIRAACCWADEIAPLISEHNMANIICLPGRFATAEQMIKWIETWLATPQSSEPRHKNRIRQISELETEFMK